MIVWMYSWREATKAHRRLNGSCVTRVLSPVLYRKMRSDSILASDPRATVLVVPPGVDPKQYGQQSNSRPDAQRWHRGSGRGRGRGRRGRGTGATRMDVD